MKPASLTISREEAARKIQVQIEKGCELINKDIRNQGEYNRVVLEKSKWTRFNIELLSRIFDNTTLADEYATLERWSSVGVSLNELVEEFRIDTQDEISRLESILERLELIPELGLKPTPTTDIDKSPTLKNDIFIVHGSDEAAQSSVARFIEQLDLHPIILHETPSSGRTIIEKFEDHSDVGFAIVLLTPDDVGYPKNKPDEKKPRARQNVIFELGYFIAKLGRNRVCALHKEDVEIPSDYHGVIYIKMDTEDGWKLKLAKEIKQVGIHFDMNKVR